MRLCVSSLTKSFGHRRVVDNVFIEVNEGEVVGLLGPNGAGKSTTFYMIVGLLKSDNGTIFMGDDDVTRLPMYKRARKGLGYLSQEPSIFRGLTVEENILAILEILPLTKKEKKEKLKKLLSELGISRLAKNKAYSLSGGEKRRVEISRALVTEPKFILLDEPFTGIDPLAVMDIQKIIAQLKERNLGVLITDHRVRETLEIIDRAYIIYEGKILFQGTANDLIKNEKAKEVYLGENFKL
ncbi:LPS export ABC transporter ATP-binding protein [bacterium]|nr:LPS export ABC transporter ATP-binding protein [bacterium]